MRITPHDIRHQQFSSKMLKGYDPHEVDAFLDDVAEDYESVLKETALLREQMAAIEERSRGVAEREKSLQETLVTTQRLAEEMKADRKSTRLNSSHLVISYAVFCLKKKKKRPRKNALTNKD